MPSKFINFKICTLIPQQPERGDSTQKQNQCIFIRGFRISIRNCIFAAVFGRRLEISSISNSTPEDIFGSQSGSSPFTPQTGWTSWSGAWFGGADRSQTSSTAPNRQAPASFNSGQCGEQQTDIQDVVLDPISTTPEVVLAVGNYYASTNLVFSGVSPLQNHPKISVG
jgi:hypothetical protein